MIAGRMGADGDDGDGEICRRPATGAYKSAARVMVVRCISWKDPTVRSLRGVLAASVCLLAVPVAFLFQLIVGSGAEIVLHLVGGVGFLLTALAVFDFKPPRWLPWIGCLSIGAFGVTFSVARHQSAAAHRLAHLPGVSNPRATSRRIVSRRFLGVV
jgi:hypothetical protein